MESVHEKYGSYLYTNLDNYIKNKYRNERVIIHDLVLETIENRKSNFVLVNADSYTGNIVVKEVVENLNNKIKLSECIQIKLNGSFYDTDDEAIKAIAKKLNSKETFEEDIIGSDTDYSNFMVNSLRGAADDTKPILFIMENFEIFCDHEKQLLYRLLDVMNHIPVPIVIIGITENFTCMDGLLERTKSRSSHFPVYLHVENDNKIDAFEKIFFIEKMEKEYKTVWNREVKKLVHDVKMREIFHNINRIDQTDKFFIDFMRRCIFYVKCEKKLSIEIFDKSYCKVYKHQNNLDFKIKNMNTLELCLLISIYHHCCNLDTIAFNFELIFGKYKEYAWRTKTLPRVDRLLAFKKFQTLIKFGLVEIKEHEKSATIGYQFITYELKISKIMIKESILANTDIQLECKQWIDNCLNNM